MSAVASVCVQCGEPDRRVIANGLCRRCYTYEWRTGKPRLATVVRGHGGGGRRPRPLLERLWAHIVVNAESGCWEWQGSTNGVGYGQIRHEERNLYVHRVMYEALAGRVAEGLELDHLCRNPRCANPSHLEAVTSRENQSRSPIANGGRSHCRHGHEFTEDNTYRWGGRRYCRTCTRRRVREHRRRAVERIRSV